jgi:hypothetical protein
MIKRVKKHVLLGVAVITTLCILLFVKLYPDFYDLFGPPDEEVAVEIAEKIGIEPNWEVIRFYMVESIEPGMKKEEVHAVFDEIGCWEVYFADIEETKSWYPDYDNLSCG